MQNVVDKWLHLTKIYDIEMYMYFYFSFKFNIDKARNM